MNEVESKKMYDVIDDILGEKFINRRNYANFYNQAKNMSMSLEEYAKYQRETKELAEKILERSVGYNELYIFRSGLARNNSIKDLETWLYEKKKLEDAKEECERIIGRALDQNFVRHAKESGLSYLEYANLVNEKEIKEKERAGIKKQCEEIMGCKINLQVLFTSANKMGISPIECAHKQVTDRNLAESILGRKVDYSELRMFRVNFASNSKVKTFEEWLYHKKNYDDTLNEFIEKGFGDLNDFLSKWKHFPDSKYDNFWDYYFNNQKNIEIANKLITTRKITRSDIVDIMGHFNQMKDKSITFEEYLADRNNMEESKKWLIRIGVDFRNFNKDYWRYYRNSREENQSFKDWYMERENEKNYASRILNKKISDKDMHNFRVGLSQIKKSNPSITMYDWINNLANLIKYSKIDPYKNNNSFCIMPYKQALKIEIKELIPIKVWLKSKKELLNFTAQYRLNRCGVVWAIGINEKLIYACQTIDINNEINLMINYLNNDIPKRVSRNRALQILSYKPNMIFIDFIIYCFDIKIRKQEILARESILDLKCLICQNKEQEEYKYD